MSDPAEPIVCPVCGSPDVAPILYGLPAPGAFEAVERAEVIIGGCVLREATDGCRACGARWAETVDWNAQPLG